MLQVLSEMESYWQRQFNQNYTRSLDHRSFYFKVIDKKVLGQRHTIQEIKEYADASQQRPEAALQVHTSAPAEIKLRPHIVLEMPDKCVLTSSPSAAAAA
jgi:histone deacetylase complex regulatory component SIN3